MPWHAVKPARKRASGTTAAAQHEVTPSIAQVEYCLLPATLSNRLLEQMRATSTAIIRSSAGYHDGHNAVISPSGIYQHSTKEPLPNYTSTSHRDNLSVPNVHVIASQKSNWFFIPPSPLHPYEYRHAQTEYTPLPSPPGRASFQWKTMEN